jgi:hypothetical protein
MNRRRRSTYGAALLVTLTALAATLALSAAAAPRSSRAAAPCGGVAKGAPWTYKGQKGTAYTVVGVNGASCALGLTYLRRWTHERANFDLTPTPTGWHCSAIGDYSALAKLGQCTTKQGGIFEWLPKRKK